MGCLAELDTVSYNASFVMIMQKVTVYYMLLSLICLWKLLSLLSDVSLSCGEFQFGCEQTTGPASMSYYKSITRWLEIGLEGESCRLCPTLNKHAQKHTHAHIDKSVSCSCTTYNLTFTLTACALVTDCTEVAHWPKSNGVTACECREYIRYITLLVPLCFNWRVLLECLLQLTCHR